MDELNAIVPLIPGSLPRRIVRPAMVVFGYVLREALLALEDKKFLLLLPATTDPIPFTVLEGGMVHCHAQPSTPFLGDTWIVPNARRWRFESFEIKCNQFLQNAYADTFQGRPLNPPLPACLPEMPMRLHVQHRDLAAASDLQPPKRTFGAVLLGRTVVPET